MSYCFSHPRESAQIRSEGGGFSHPREYAQIRSEGGNFLSKGQVLMQEVRGKEVYVGMGGKGGRCEVKRGKRSI